MADRFPRGTCSALPGWRAFIERKYDQGSAHLGMFCGSTLQNPKKGMDSRSQLVLLGMLACWSTSNVQSRAPITPCARRAAYDNHHALMEARCGAASRGNLLISRWQFADPIGTQPYFNIHGLGWVWFDADLDTARDPKGVDQIA
jgi:hypothetical protein